MYLVIPTISHFRIFSRDTTKISLQSYLKKLKEIIMFDLRNNYNNASCCSKQSAISSNSWSFVPYNNTDVGIPLVACLTLRMGNAIDG